jgi:hypothetical protein
MFEFIVVNCLYEVMVVELIKNSNIIIYGFFVWLFIAPRRNNSKYGEFFLAYMTALLCSLVGSTELMMVKPVAFFFTIGGVFAFFYVVVRKTIRIAIRK